MNFLQQFISKLYLTDSQEIKKYNIFVIVGIILFTILIQVVFIFQTKNTVKKIELINQKRKDIIKLLERKARVQAEKERIEGLVLKDRQFRIKEYCMFALRAINLDAKLAKDFDAVGEQDLGNGYAELALNGSFKNLTTKELVILLEKLEENQRVYFKEIKIIQSGTSNIDLNFIVATLKVQEPVGK